MWTIRKKYVALEFYHAFQNNSLLILDKYFSLSIFNRESEFAMKK